ncbi:MAG: Glycerophosphodiester phosphodiesterase, cytoplasmic [Anaerolineales bacterium]|nr:Glycerophosphodiester phosphodiesterase, cytoplasmic [Anaerolineales bacterium]
MRLANLRKSLPGLEFMIQRYLCPILFILLAACGQAPHKPAYPLTESKITMSDQNPYRCDTSNIAHRGARSLAPENTLAAARKGLDAGADMWELDVQLTAAGALILVHDDTLDRTSNVEEVFPDRRPWRVSDFTLAEIRQLDFGSWFNETDPFGEIAAGNVSTDEQESYVDEPAPTLRQALEWTRDNDWRVNVELKALGDVAGAATFVEDVVFLIEELDMVDRVLISSFDHDYVKRAKTANSDVRVGALANWHIDDVAGYIRELGADAYNPSVKIVAAPSIPALRDQGIDVFVYTVNDVEKMAELAEAGASGLFTDYPQRLARVLEQCRSRE